MSDSSNKFLSVDPKESTIPEVHKLLLGGVAPRPIALVSTISEDGINNLSPFSFFNAFGANPPIVAFSPSNRGRDGSTKDTLNNLKLNKECVIQSVSYNIVQQVSLSSTEYDSDIDEFLKSGLTPIKSDIVKPKRVKESPFQMECKVNQIIPLGEKNASGNLVICEVVKFHVAESVMNNGVIDPNLIDLVGRNSANFYTRASLDALFEIEKPIATLGIGIDQLPDFIKKSEILSANNLGQLGNLESLPDDECVNSFMNAYTDIKISPEELVKVIDSGDYNKLFMCGVTLFETDKTKAKELIEIAATKALSCNDSDFAIKAMLSIPKL